MYLKVLNGGLLLALLVSSACANGAARGSDQTVQAMPAEISDGTGTPGYSWEAWIHHGRRDGAGKEPHTLSGSSTLATRAPVLAPAAEARRGADTDGSGSR